MPITEPNTVLCEFEIAYEPLSHSQAVITHCVDKQLTRVQIWYDTRSFECVAGVINSVKDMIFASRALSGRVISVNDLGVTMSSQVGDLIEHMIGEYKSLNSSVLRTAPESSRPQNTPTRVTAKPPTGDIAKTINTMSNCPALFMGTPKAATKLRNYVNNVTGMQYSADEVDAICQYLCRRGN